MTTVTTKQVSASLRQTLGKLAGTGGTLTYGNGTEITLPPGLGFSVRAAARSVSITIEDRGWVDHVTGGDRERIGEYRAEEEAIVAEVDKIRALYDPPLPGTTKWGVIVISATPGTVTHVGN